MTTEWFNMVKYHGLGDTPTFQATYDICTAALRNGVPGDFVECGVYAGAHPAIMAKAIMEHVANRGEYALRDNRRVHLFDSFEGIPLAGPHDDELKGKPFGVSACSLDQVKANMKTWGIPDELLVYHPGWFADTVPQWTGYKRREIAVLRLDGDLYDSTKVCLEHLEPLVSDGGCVIIDDFNLAGCRKAVLEYCVPAPVYWYKPTK